MSTDNSRDARSADKPQVPSDGDDRSACHQEIARQALDEAQARRKATDQTVAEVGGRGGLDPVRYGDWEVKGIASDF